MQPTFKGPTGRRWQTTALPATAVMQTAAEQSLLHGTADTALTQRGVLTVPQPDFSLEGLRDGAVWLKSLDYHQLHGRAAALPQQNKEMMALLQRIDAKLSTLEQTAAQHRPS